MRKKILYFVLSKRSVVVFCHLILLRLSHLHADSLICVSFCLCNVELSFGPFQNVCIGGESNPGLPRGRREFYH